MKDVLECLAVVLIILLVLSGPILVIGGLIGKIPLSILNPLAAGRGWKLTDIHLKGMMRVLIGVIGTVLWVAVWTVAYFILCSVFPGLPTCSPVSEPTPTHTSTSISTDALTPVPLPTLADTPARAATPPPASRPKVTSIATSTQISCVCQSATDDDTLRCLIHTESEAANNDDLGLITRIFAPDATIFRGDTRKEWYSPTAYYSPTFAILDFTEARHFDIRQMVIKARSARYTSGSSGYYAEPGATPTPYYNDDPSEHWIFGKDDQGCWVIMRLEFNASHIDFP
jgi:hypothetical protein